MNKPVSRRTFLGGAALAGSTLLGACSGYRRASDAVLAAASAPQAPTAAYYPPALLGLRGDHDGSQSAAHAVALGGKRHTLPETAAESYDLIVIGAGLSGLSAAYFYRRQRPDAKILIVDNHDDFGGHAKRNEFTVDGKLLISYGGSESLDSPKSSFSKTVHTLLNELGVDYRKLGSHFRQDLYERQWQLKRGVFFSRAAFGRSAVTPHPEPGKNDAAAHIALFPLDDVSRQALTELYTRPADYWRGKSRSQKQALAGRTSYYRFLADTVKLPEGALRYLADISREYWGHPITAVSVAEAVDNGYPGLSALGLHGEAEEKEPYIYHFPDGNASIARLLVRKMIPAAADGHTMEDIVLSRFDYSALDRDGSPVRIRLNTTALLAENRPDGRVAVACLSRGQEHLQRFDARHCIFAGHSALAARIMPEMKGAQQQAMTSNVKVPMIYTKVAVKNSMAFKKLGMRYLYCPESPYCLIQLDDPVDIGGYRAPDTPQEPNILHMVRIATADEGKDARDMYRQGRLKLREESYDDLKTEALGQLREIYALAGENLDDVLAGITVNRWAHGYSYEQVGLFDSDRETERTTAAMQKRIGNILMAGSDVAWMPYLQNAVDEAHRAVKQALR